MVERTLVRFGVTYALAFLALITGAAWAQPPSHTVYTTPLYLYTPAFGGPKFTSLGAADSYVQGLIDGCDGGTCVTVVNLYPNTTGPFGILYNGTIWYEQYFDEQTCSVNGCNTQTEAGAISTAFACPNTLGGPTQYDSQPGPPKTADPLCGMTYYDTQPPPNHYCKSCLGNPIYAATGQKFQVDTDYSAPTGLDFARSYRSNNGYFGSVLTQAFVDGSLPIGTSTSQCYPGNWSQSSQSGYYCFPYVSAYYAGGPSPQYQLQTADGRSIEFTGPNSAVTQAADINERVTQITFQGSSAWQVKREDDTIEIYAGGSGNTHGQLLQSTQRGGRTFTYAYSTTSTPANIAPYPGLLITESDAFGHTLSFQYNSSGQMTQMTDPSGQAYGYQYGASASSPNLLSVTYPDQTGRAYEYNESANTSGANLPSALTGITDESQVRYATFRNVPIQHERARDHHAARGWRRQLFV